uniref:Homeobox domain-containing protein n=1 Tax=Salix viminalis TaxID=40686 RepID=A0A6N2NJ68_SALVM
MEDNQGRDPNSASNHATERSEPVRSRWTPKPEQILILESIFNSGMVNPPKDETVRIRKLLEKFGSVGDANVFYWFQNRRSRSRRRQRQMQASLVAGEHTSNQQAQAGGGAIQYKGVVDEDHGGESLYSFSNQMNFQELDQISGVTSILCPSETSNLHYQTPGCITVFINGLPTEVPRGPLDMTAMFGQDVVLVHSSGVPLPTNESGFLMQSLHHGESYFLVIISGD